MESKMPQSIAGRIARKVRANTDYWGTADDSLAIADQEAVEKVEDTPIGDLWKFSDGSIMVNNNRYVAAVAKGEILRITQGIFETHRKSAGDATTAPTRV